MNKRLVGMIAKVALGICLMACVAFGSVAIAEGVQTRAAGEVWTGDVAGSFAGGDGSADNPFLISNGAELARLAMVVRSGYNRDRYNNGDVHYRLTRNIRLNDTTNWKDWGTETHTQGLGETFITPVSATQPPWNNVNQNEQGYNIWESIGGHGGVTVFMANFNGGGNIVSGVLGNSIFGTTYNATIKNLGVESSFIEGFAAAGGIVEHAMFTTITNTYFAGIVRGIEAVGGIVGGLSASTIENSFVTGSVELHNYVPYNVGRGGVIGAAGGGRGIYSYIRNTFFLQNDNINFGLNTVGRIYEYTQITNDFVFGLDGILDGTLSIGGGVFADTLYDAINGWVAHNQRDAEPFFNTWSNHRIERLLYQEDDIIADDEEIWGGVNVEYHSQRNLTWLYVLLGVFGVGAIASGTVWIVVARKKNDAQS